MNDAEEAVEEELSLLSSCLQQLYLDKMMTQLLHLVFMSTPAANLLTDEFLCQSANSKAKATNSIANRTNSFANGMKSIAKRTNSISKTCNNYESTS